MVDKTKKHVPFTFNNHSFGFDFNINVFYSPNTDLRTVIFDVIDLSGNEKLNFKDLFARIDKAELQDMDFDTFDEFRLEYCILENKLNQLYLFAKKKGEDNEKMFRVPITERERLSFSLHTAIMDAGIRNGFNEIDILKGTDIDIEITYPLEHKKFINDTCFTFVKDVNEEHENPDMNFKFEDDNFSLDRYKISQGEVELDGKDADYISVDVYPFRTTNFYIEDLLNRENVEPVDSKFSLEMDTLIKNCDIKIIFCSTGDVYANISLVYVKDYINNADATEEKEWDILIEGDEKWLLTNRFDMLLNEMIEISNSGVVTDNGLPVVEVNSEGVKIFERYKSAAVTKRLTEGLKKN